MLKSLLAVLVTLCFMLPAPAATPPAFYISPSGNDADAGTRAKPFATLTRARDALRARFKTAPRQNATIWLRGGVYELSEALTFSAQDGGDDAHSVTYAALPNQAPILSGGQKITNWRKSANAIWTAPVPDGANFRQLFVNGARRERARSQGFFRVLGDISLDERAQFKADAKDADFAQWQAWAARGNVEVVALQAWAELRMTIQSATQNADGSTNVTLSGKPTPSNRESNARYYVENAPDLLSKPGQWFLDAKTKTVSYWPLPSENMARVEVVAPRLTQLVRLEGSASQPVRNLHFRGLKFQNADWTLPPQGYADGQAAVDIPGAFYADGARNCSLVSCDVRGVGGYGVEFSRACQNNRIERCNIQDVGAGGIKIGETRARDGDAEQTRANIVRDCRVHEIGAVYPAGVGVLVALSGENLIAHNEIWNTFYTGISVGWSWGYDETPARANTIEFNHVHDIGRGMLSDMGGIYTLGLQPGTIIRNNVFHDITRVEPGYGGWGIYLDEGSSDVLVTNNIVYRTSSGGFHQHYGRENIVRNNVFAFARDAQIIRTRPEAHRSFSFFNNIVMWDVGPLLGSNWDGNISNYLLDYNLYFPRLGQPVTFANRSFDEWKKSGQDVHSRFGDPQFLAPDKGDFRTAPGSAAARIGFQPIDVAGVGPRVAK